MEYFATSKFIKEGSAIVIEFTVESNEIDKMNRIEFFREMISKKLTVIHCISKLLHVNASQVERMIPIQGNKGVSFVFIIHSDPMHHNTTWKMIHVAASDGSLATVKCGLFVCSNIVTMI